MKKMEMTPPKVLKTLLNEGKCDKQQEWVVSVTMVIFPKIFIFLHHDLRITNMNLKW